MVYFWIFQFWDLGVQVDKGMYQGWWCVEVKFFSYKCCFFQFIELFRCSICQYIKLFVFQGSYCCGLILNGVEDYFLWIGFYDNVCVFYLIVLLVCFVFEDQLLIGFLVYQFVRLVVIYIFWFLVEKGVGELFGKLVDFFVVFGEGFGFFGIYQVGQGDVCY